MKDVPLVFVHYGTEKRTPNRSNALVERDPVLDPIVLDLFLITRAIGSKTGFFRYGLLILPITCGTRGSQNLTRNIGLTWTA